MGASTVFGNVRVRVGIKDVVATDGDPAYQSVTLNWTVGVVPGSAPMKWAGADLFQATIPGVPNGASVSFTVTCVDRAGNSGVSAPVVFSPTAYPPLTLTVSTTGVGDVAMTILGEGQGFANEYLLASSLTTGPVGGGPFLGLGPDAFLFLQLPFGLPPFHDVLDANGAMSVSFGGASCGKRWRTGQALPPRGARAASARIGRSWLGRPRAKPNPKPNEAPAGTAVPPCRRSHANCPGVPRGVFSEPLAHGVP